MELRGIPQSYGALQQGKSGGIFPLDHWRLRFLDLLKSNSEEQFRGGPGTYIEIVETTKCRQQNAGTLTHSPVPLNEGIHDTLIHRM